MIASGWTAPSRAALHLVGLAGALAWAACSTGGGSRPAAPAGLAAVAASPTQVELTWTDRSSDETGFRLERQEGGAGAWAALAAPGRDATSFTDGTVAPRTRYVYRLCASNAAGDSAYAGPAEVVTPGPPDAPAGLAAAASGPHAVALSWTPPAGGPTGYRLERAAAAGGPFQVVAEPAAGASSFTDGGLSGGTAYWYRLFARNAWGDSAPSAVASATTAPAPITVTGRAVRLVGYLDLQGFSWPPRLVPAPGIRVAVAGGAAVTTGEDGAFTLTGVVPPYDLLAHDPAPAGGGHSVAWLGLTRADPTVLFPRAGDPVPPASTATVRGALTGVAAAGLGDQPTGSVAFASPEVFARASTDAAGAYLLSPGWSGPATTTGALRALAWARDPGSGQPTAFAQAEHEAVTLGAGADVSVELPLAPVPVATFTGTTAAPEGLTMSWRAVRLQYGDGAPSAPFAYEARPDGPFSWQVPVLPDPGATLSLYAVASGMGLSEGQFLGLTPTQAGAALALAAPPVPATPADQTAHQGTGATFTWTPVAGGVHDLVLYTITYDRVGPARYEVYTAGATVAFPDFAAVGDPLPADGAFRWSVEAFAPVADLDALAATGLWTAAAGSTALHSSGGARLFTTGDPLLFGGGSFSVKAGDSARFLHVLAVGSTDPVTWTLEGPGAISISEVTGTHITYFPPARLDAPAHATLTAAFGAARAVYDITLTPG